MITIEGTLEHIIYRNAQNGYSVMELSDESGSVIIVGNLPELSPGDLVRVEGDFVTHPSYGEQLLVERCTLTVPTTVRAIERYLASGIIKGIGPMLASASSPASRRTRCACWKKNRRRWPKSPASL